MAPEPCALLFIVKKAADFRRERGSTRLSVSITTEYPFCGPKAGYGRQKSRVFRRAGFKQRPQTYQHKTLRGGVLAKAEARDLLRIKIYFQEFSALFLPHSTYI
jgi:hypothetical protein